MCISGVLCFLQTCVISALNFSLCTGKEGSSALKETGVSNKFFSEDMALLCSAQHWSLDLSCQWCLFFPHAQCATKHKHKVAVLKCVVMGCIILCVPKALFLNVDNQVTGTGGPFGTSNIQEHLLPFDLSIFKSLHQIEVWLRYCLLLQALNPSCAACLNTDNCILRLGARNWLCNL